MKVNFKRILASLSAAAVCCTAMPNFRNTAFNIIANAAETSYEEDGVITTVATDVTTTTSATTTTTATQSAEGTAVTTEVLTTAVSTQTSEITTTTAATETSDTDITTAAVITTETEATSVTTVTTPFVTVDTVETDINGVFQISTAGELLWFAEYVNNEDLSADAVLLNDIYINYGEVSSTESIEFIPVGSYFSPYSGTFDGKGYGIYGVYLNSTGDYQGLFGGISEQGTVSNLNIYNTVISGGNYVGGICGNNKGTISDCTVNADVSGKMYIGGICGENYGNIKNSCSRLSVAASFNYAGGISGVNYGTVQSCYNSGSVKGIDNVGGICGSNTHNTIRYCFNTGSINGNDSVGGICGINYDTIENCYSTVPSSASGEKSGYICGENGNTIKNCFFIKGEAADNLTNTIPATADELAVYKMTGFTLSKNEPLISETETKSSTKTYYLPYLSWQKTDFPTSSVDVYNFGSDTVQNWSEYEIIDDITDLSSLKSGKYVITEDILLDKTSYKIPDGCTVAIKDDAALTVSEKTTLTIEGSLIVDGALIVNGTVTNNNEIINNGLIENNGEIKNKGFFKNTGKITSPVNNGAYDGFVFDTNTSDVKIENDKIIYGDSFYTYKKAQTIKISDDMSKVEVADGITADITLTDADDTEYVYDCENALWLIVTKPEHFKIKLSSEPYQYNGEPLELSVTAPEDMGKYEVIFIHKANGETDEAVEPGIYTIKIKVYQNEFYTAAELENEDWTFSIEKAPAPEFKLPTASVIVYGDKLSESVLSDENWQWSEPEILPTVKNNGYEAIMTVNDVKYDYSDVENYNSETHTVSAIIELIVLKAKPEYEKPEKLTAGYGSTLADVILPESWLWDEPTDSVGNIGETHEHFAIFIPDDIENYEIIVETLNVTVVKGIPKVNPVIPETEYTEGDAVPEITLSENDTAGTIVWDTIDSVLKAGENILTWTFTPEDSENYIVTSGTVVINAVTSTTTSTTVSTTTTSTSASTSVSSTTSTSASTTVSSTTSTSASTSVSTTASTSASTSVSTTASTSASTSVSTTTSTSASTTISTTASTSASTSISTTASTSASTSVSTTTTSTSTTVTTSKTPSITIDVTIVAPGNPNILGDANIDGKLDIRDAALIASKLAKGLSASLPKNADFDKDGKISVRDAASIARFLAAQYMIQ